MDTEERPKPDPTKGLWDVKETAEFLDLRVSAVRALLSSGKLIHYRVGLSGGRVKIKPADAEAYLQTCRRGPVPSPVVTASASREDLFEGVDHYAKLGIRRG